MLRCLRFQVAAKKKKNFMHFFEFHLFKEKKMTCSIYIDSKFSMIMCAHKESLVETSSPGPILTVPIGAEMVPNRSLSFQKSSNWRRH